MKRSKNILNAVFLSVIFVVSYSILLYYSLSSDFIHNDEKDTIRRTAFFQHFIQMNFGSKIWNSEEAYDQPLLQYYIYGSALQLFPATSINTIFRICPPATILSYEQLSRLAVNPEFEHIESVQTKCSYFHYYVMRTTAILFSAGSLVFIYILCTYLFGKFVAFISILLILFNPAYSTGMITAMGDAPLIFFMMLDLLLITIYFRNIKTIAKYNYFRASVVIGIVTGLALSTKLNGIIGLPVFWFMLCIQAMIQKWYGVKYLIYSAVISFVYTFIVFIILNPYVWSNPYGRFRTMIEYRLSTMTFQERIPNNDGLIGIQNKFTRIFSNTLLPKGIYTTFPGKSNNIPVDLVLFIIGIYLILKNISRKNNQFNISYIIFCIWSLLIIGSTIFIIPADWTRYYIPLIIIIKIVQANILNIIPIQSFKSKRNLNFPHGQ